MALVKIKQSVQSVVCEGKTAKWRDDSYREEKGE